jgi:hypothetical protein
MASAATPRARRKSMSDFAELAFSGSPSFNSFSLSKTSSSDSRSSSPQLNLESISGRKTSLSISKTTFSPLSKSCRYDNLREVGLRMSQEISVRDVRPHLLSPTYSSVFRGKEAAIWMKAAKNIVISHSPGDDERDDDWHLGVLDWMLREKLIFRVVVPMIAIPPPRGAPEFGRGAQKKNIVKGPESTGVLPRDRFSETSKALYRFNDALIADKHIHVVVHKARGLLGKSRDGSSSPFVRIEFGRQRAETKVVTKDLNPRWDEHFTFGMVERKERTPLLKISVWDSHVDRSAFLGQKTVFIASNGMIKVPYVTDTDAKGYATNESCPSPQWHTLMERSVKSCVAGSLLITTYVTDFKFSPHLKVRAFSGKKYFESDPLLMVQAMRETFGCVLSHEEMGAQGALAAASSSGLWDLVIRLKSLHSLDLIGEAEDLKVASALLLPGMQWKNRVKARVKWSSNHGAELESPWILRKNGVWNGQEGTMRMSGLLHEDIRQGQIELEVIMRDNWAAEWDKNARILGTSATFTLEELPRLIGETEKFLLDELMEISYETETGNKASADDSGVIHSNSILQDFPVYVRTFAGKSHLVRNGTVRGAIYLVPSTSPSGGNSWNDDIALIQKENDRAKFVNPPVQVPPPMSDLILDIVVDTPFPRLRRYLFSDDTGFLLSFYSMLSYRNISLGPWECGGVDKQQPRSEKASVAGMSRKVTFLLPEGRAVSQKQVVESQFCAMDEEGICMVDIANMTEDLPMRELFDSRIQIAIIYETHKFTRIRVSADFVWYGKQNWSENNKASIKAGFISGVTEKYSFLKQSLDWAANRQWSCIAQQKEDTLKKGPITQTNVWHMICSALLALILGVCCGYIFG